ncbi:prefoldin subunit [Thermovibrio ammonificans]|jgi:chaperonin cofactor prefoldin|uniref:Uncharacterized protein n=1 Tax=Thermovibrio ammonificans (strain DSM 15698 / JCM 12110 / HB-1) TaxID=648996 RepID=E8T680_THEA1|nr:prefoldin subunit [Thermovibrio ammonificans]ADU96664.1 hypothetical protein Theam_0696 [Thermovibrio ammonificans HB-1]
MRKETTSKEAIIEFLERLPEGRRIYYSFGSVMVEVTKEEAIKLLKEEDEGAE